MKVSEGLRKQIQELKEALAKSKEAHKLTERNARLREKDLKREITKIQDENTRAMEGQASKFKRESSLMRSKVTHVELVLDNADKRHMATEVSIRGQLKAERKERGEREGAHASQIKLLKERIEELRRDRDNRLEQTRITGDRANAIEKELRSHIETSERFNKTADKRGLILAGADRVMRELTAIFKDDPQFAEPIENAMNAVWAKVYSEISN